MRVGYVRVSSTDQNPARQLADVVVERTFTDQASGSTTDRPGLAELRRFVRQGDTVVVHSMDRLARDLGDLRVLVREFVDQGVVVEFATERLTFTGQQDAMAELQLSMLGAVAEFERAQIRERQAQGIAAAKARGVYKGRKPSLTAAQAAEARALVADGVSKAAVARRFKVSRDTIYRCLDQSAVVGQ
jgi:DNA invertase Pin-like site-specific DNA recombinase